MYVAKKKGQRSPLLLVIMWSAASPQPRHPYAHNKRKIVLQSCFCTVVIGEKKFFIPTNVDNIED